MKNRSEKIYKGKKKETEKKEIIIKKGKKNALRQEDSQLLQAGGGMKHMQRISTWTVFKGEPGCFQAGSEGCCSSRTPGAAVPASPEAPTRPSPRAPGVSSTAPARGGRGDHPEQAAMPRGAGAWCLVCGFWVSLCREATTPSCLFGDALPHAASKQKMKKCSC